MKTPNQELIEHFNREVKLGFLSQENVNRIIWYINTYWIEKEKKFASECYDEGYYTGVSEEMSDFDKFYKQFEKV